MRGGVCVVFREKKPRKKHLPLFSKQEGATIQMGCDSSISDISRGISRRPFLGYGRRFFIWLFIPETQLTAPISESKNHLLKINFLNIRTITTHRRFYKQNKVRERADFRKASTKIRNRRKVVRRDTIRPGQDNTTSDRKGSVGIPDELRPRTQPELHQ